MRLETVQRRTRRTRIYMIVVFLAIAVASWYLYDDMQHMASVRSVQHKETFYQYVTEHDLGTLTLIDSGTGVDPMAYVLQLQQPVPDDQRQAFAMNLAHLYAEYDRGSDLTIVYVDPATHKQTVIAESHYDDDQQTVQLTIDQSDGTPKQITRSVDW